MDNSILLIENNLSSLNKNSLFFEGVIYTKTNESLEDIILFKDLIFSLTLNEDYTLTLKKLYSSLNVYYSEFINFSIVIENKNGLKKLELNLTSYFLDFLDSSLKNIILEETDIISIEMRLFKLSKFKNKIYNKSSIIKTSSFNILHGTLVKLENKFINLKAISNSDNVEISGIYSKNTNIFISYFNKVVSLITDDFGYFNISLPHLPLGLSLRASAEDSFPHQVNVIHQLTRYSLRNSIIIYSIFNIPCKISNITFDLHTRKFKVKSYSNGILANFENILFSFIIFAESGDIIFEKEFNGNSTEKDLIEALNNIEIKNNFYLCLKSSYEIFKFASQNIAISDMILYISENEITKISEPEISLDFNSLNIKSIYENSNIVIKIDDTISKYENETGNLSIFLSKDIKFNTKVTVWLEKDNFKTLPINFYTTYKNKNKTFLLNTNLEIPLLTTSKLKDISDYDTFFLTAKYALPFYFFEEGYGKISISVETNENYTLYLLNNNKLEEFATLTTNVQNKFKIPSNGVIFIDLKNLQKNNTKIKILFKPLDICYKSLLTFNTRDTIKKSHVVFNDFSSFKNILATNNTLNSDSLIISKYFSLYIFDKSFFKDIDTSFSLFYNLLSQISYIEQKDF